MKSIPHIPALVVAIVVPLLGAAVALLGHLDPAASELVGALSAFVGAIGGGAHWIALWNQGRAAGDAIAPIVHAAIDARTAPSVSVSPPVDVDYAALAEALAPVLVGGLDRLGVTLASSAPDAAPTRPAAPLAGSRPPTLPQPPTVPTLLPTTEEIDRAKAVLAAAGQVKP